MDSIITSIFTIVGLITKEILGLELTNKNVSSLLLISFYLFMICLLIIYKASKFVIQRVENYNQKKITDYYNTRG